MESAVDDSKRPLIFRFPRGAASWYSRTTVFVSRGTASAPWTSPPSSPSSLTLSRDADQAAEPLILHVRPRVIPGASCRLYWTSSGWRLHPATPRSLPGRRSPAPPDAGVRVRPCVSGSYSGPSPALRQAFTPRSTVCGLKKLLCFPVLAALLCRSSGGKPARSSSGTSPAAVIFLPRRPWFPVVLVMATSW